jgi:hypothetical protein
MISTSTTSIVTIIDYLVSGIIVLALTTGVLFLVGHFTRILTEKFNVPRLHFFTHICSWGVLRIGYFVIHMISLERSNVLDRYANAVYNLASIFFYSSMCIATSTVIKNRVQYILYMIFIYCLLCFQTLLSLMTCITAQDGTSLPTIMSTDLTQYSFHLGLCVYLGIVFAVFAAKYQSVTDDQKITKPLLFGVITGAFLVKALLNCVRLVMIMFRWNPSLYTVTAFGISALTLDIVPLFIVMDTKAIFEVKDAEQEEEQAYQ